MNVWGTKPEPGQVRVDEFSVTNNTIECVSDRWITPPPLDVVSVKNIKQVALHDNQIFAIDTQGKLLAGSTIVMDILRNKIVKQIGVLGYSCLHFVTTDAVISTKNISGTLYEGEAIDIFAGAVHAFIKTPNGYMVAGSNMFNQYGFAVGHPRSDNDAYVAVPTLNELPIAELCIGGWHNYAKLTDGTFVGWGYNTDGRLGNKGTQHVIAPVKLDHHKLGIEKIVGAAWHTIGITRDGDVYIWGINVDGNLGPATQNGDYNTPQKILSGKNIIRAITGSYSSNTLLVSNTGTVFAWGKNESSRLGITSSAHIVDEPTEVKALSKNGIARFGIKSAFLGYYRVMIVLESGKEFHLKNRDKFTDVSICTCKN